LRNAATGARLFLGMVSRTGSLARGALLAAVFLAASASRAAAQRAGQPPVLTAFSINAGSDTVSASAVGVALVHTVVGTPPSDFRVSRRADFLGARWEPYVEMPILRDWYDPAGEACDATRPSHRLTLYLQVRSTVGNEVRIVDGQRQLQPARIESNVLRASICARTDRPPL